MSDVPVQPRWRILLTPRWLGWHLFAVLAVAGMCWLGDWQFQRALAGNTLSWAYTFEWPIFAIFGVVFWVKTIRDELHPAAGDGTHASTEVTLPAGSAAAELPPGADALGSEASSRPGGSEKAGSDDVELAEYNAYLAKLSSEVKGHGKWHGLR
jgi:hypothetical protein